MPTVKKVVGPVISYANKQDIRQRLVDNIQLNFSATIGKEKDIVNIMMALIQLESSFRPDAAHLTCEPSISSGARDYWNSSVIQKKLVGADAVTFNNLRQGLRAWGLMASMGWNQVKGASGSGKCEIELQRPDLAPSLIVLPGDSISAKFDGVANIDNQLTVGLIMFESKYTKVAPRLVASGKYSDKLTAAVSAYLGLGARDVRTGITPEAYASSIIRGQAYKIANGFDSPGAVITASTPTQTVSGPVTTAASGQNQVPPGC